MREERERRYRFIQTANERGEREAVSLYLIKPMKPMREERGGVALFNPRERRETGGIALFKQIREERERRHRFIQTNERGERQAASLHSKQLEKREREAVSLYSKQLERRDRGGITLCVPLLLVIPFLSVVLSKCMVV